MASDRPAVQTVRNAWILALRKETLRVGTPEMARVAHVGHMIATYADADGSNARPSQQTLATLVGGTDEAVARAVKVLIAVGVLAKKRRPNANAMYQLLMPTGQKLDWATHMPLYTDTRQKRARAREKERYAEALAAASDTVPGGEPEPVPGRESGTRPRTVSGVPEPVAGRPRNPSQDRFRNPSQAGGTDTPTFGRDPEHDTDTPGLSQQPPVRARDARTDEPALLPTNWTPSAAAIEAAQANRLAAGCPVLTGSQVVTVTRRFRTRMRADHWLTTPQCADERWVRWAERETADATDQPPLLLGLPGGQHDTPAVATPPPVSQQPPHHGRDRDTG